MKGNLKFWANLNISPEGNHYHILEIGTPENPYHGIPALYIKLPDRRVLSLAKLDGNYIKEIGERTTVAKGEYPVDWPKGAEDIYLGAYNLVVYENKMLYFSARHLGGEHWEKIAPVIAKTPEGPFFKFPLKEIEVKQLFGLPEKITDFFIQ